MRDNVVDDLLSAISGDPADEAPQLVMADVLIAAGDPRGELIMLDHRERAGQLSDPAARAVLRRAPATFEPLTSPGSASLWIGPAGTITPLHHDTTNILFCQIYGRNASSLVSPQETALLLDPVHGFYSPIDLDARTSAEHPALR